MMDEHENVKRSKRCGHCHEEVTSDDRLGVIRQKRRPALITTRATRRSLGHVLPYRSRRHADAQFHQQLAKNPGHIIVAINSKATERLPQAPTANDVQVFLGASPFRASG
jgi:hypothetical protein